MILKAGGIAGALVAIAIAASYLEPISAHLNVEPRVVELEQYNICQVCIEGCLYGGASAEVCLQYCRQKGACR